MDEDCGAFERRMNGMVASGFATMGVAIGHSIGLFDILVELDEPSTSKQIADKADCKERYVEELLRLMVVSDIVDFDNNKYYLPPHRRATMTSDHHLVRLAPVLPFLPCAHEELLECFKKSGPSGLPYSAHSRWFIPWRATRNSYFKTTLPFIVSQIPGLCEKLESGKQVCELGCSSGECLIIIAALYPKSNFVGIDVDDNLIEEGKTIVRQKGLQNVEFVAKDGAKFAEDYENQFDFLYMADTLHDLPFPVKALQEAYRVLKPGCYISVDDFNLDEDINKQKLNKAHSQVCLTFSIYYCLACALQYEGAVGCGASVGKQNIVGFMKTAGFKDVQVLDIEGRHGQAQFIGRKE